jgi:hypothetical protein
MEILIEKEELSDYSIGNEDLVSLKTMGHIYEICYLQKKNNEIKTQLIDKDHYIYKKTGEVFKCNHIDNRAESKFQVGQSLKRLRDYINTNVVDTNKCKWITLTYKKNMTDSKQLYNDFKRFMTRFKRRFKEYKIEYIVAMEPQSRGAWHCHCIIIFDRVAPFIPNATIEVLWEQGFTKTTKLDNIDNIGAYLTAYLGDMEFTKENIQELEKQGLNVSQMALKEVNEIEGIKLKEPKSFIKGARLYMYPPKFNLYRISRGIKKPKKEYFSYHVAKEKAGLRLPTYTKGIKISDTDNSFDNIIIYEYYNTKRK